MTLDIKKLQLPNSVDTEGISVIVPCINEEHNLAALLRLLASASEQYDGLVEILVVDGGSADGTTRVAEVTRSTTLVPSTPGRAQQMNAGVRHARYDTLYFVHADTRPPLSCLADVAAARAKGHHLGGYAFRFDSASRLLRFNSYLTTFNVLATRGGDQSIFVSREAFDGLDGYDEDFVIMEEYDLLARAKRLGYGYELLEGRTLVSDRKYAERSWIRVQLANIMAMTMWRTGVAPTRIRDAYLQALGKPAERP